MNSKYGFSMEVVFSISKHKNIFEYGDMVAQVLRYISGSSKETDYKDGDKSIMKRIRNICNENGSRIPNSFDRRK